MKQHPVLFLLLLVVMALARAEDAAPVKKETPEARRELAWPEIKDPQALIDFAKAEIAKHRKNKLYSGVVKTEEYPVFADFHLLECEIFLSESGGPFDCLYLLLDTHPFTGQALYIMPEAPIVKQLNGAGHGPVFSESPVPEIKRALLNLGYGRDGSGMWSMSRTKLSVNWLELLNQNEAGCTWATPLEMRLPSYPFAMLREGIEGVSTISFTVSETGELSEVEIKASAVEFEAVVREAVSHWRFEAAIDRTTRLSVKTRYSGKIGFRYEEN